MVNPTPNLIKLQKITLELERLENRIMEIIGERTTLETKKVLGQIDDTLFKMKIECLNYEVINVIQPKIDSLIDEDNFIGMLMKSKIELSEN